MSQIIETLLVPREHPCYAGHFPGNPIVPGAVLLQWLTLAMERAQPGWLVQEVPSIKFLAEVKPGDRLDVSARFNGEEGRLKLIVAKGGEPVCKASFLLARSAPD